MKGIPVAFLSGKKCVIETITSFWTIGKADTFLFKRKIDFSENYL